MILRSPNPAEPIIDCLAGHSEVVRDSGYRDVMRDTHQPETDAKELPICLLNILDYANAVAARHLIRRRPKRSGHLPEAS